MGLIKDNCNPEMLKQSLTEQLPEESEERLIAHLDQCAQCRLTLEALAGAPTDWSTIEEALAEERYADTLHWSAISDTQKPIPGDFAVDFLHPSDNEESIGRLDDIEIQSVIGHGGNGIVLKGYQPELRRLVAVKVMAPSLAASAAARQRFGREAQATAAVVHPNVMPILTVHSDGQLPYLVTPFVDCESLQQRLDKQGSLDVKDVLGIAHQVASGLAAAHAQGLVHRDVKPANILLEKKVNRVMLTDFGLARAADDASLTRTGLIAGTPSYMSPEQARGDSIDHRSDLFSLGSVMYTMASGRPPFRAETVYGILRRVTDETPRPVHELNSQIPLWLSVLISRFQHSNPEDRVSDSETAAELLKECLAHVQQPTAFALPASVRQMQAEAGRRRLIEKTAPFLKTPHLLIALLLVIVAVLVLKEGSVPAETNIAAVESTARTSAADDRDSSGQAFGGPRKGSEGDQLGASKPQKQSHRDHNEALPVDSTAASKPSDPTDNLNEQAAASQPIEDPALDWSDDVSEDLQSLDFELQLLDLQLNEAREPDNSK